MTTWNIFYNSNKEIMWASTAPVNNTIITAEAAKGYTHVELDNDDTPVPEKFYINSDATAISEKTVFNPSFDITSAAVDDVITVTGVSSATEVFVDGTSKGTMSDTTLTFTAKDSGVYTILFKKDKYVDYIIKYTVNRYS
jgi:hypothetical protein